MIISFVGCTLIDLDSAKNQKLHMAEKKRFFLK